MKLKKSCVKLRGAAQPRIFKGRVGLLEERNFDKYLIYNTWKESPTRKHFRVLFFWILLKQQFEQQN